MAALSDAPWPEVLELTRLTVRDISPLFSHEIGVWKQRFAWDFRPSVEILTRFVQMHSLYGYALRVGHEVVGYAYSVCEGKKGLIGDFFVREDYNHPGNEILLLRAVVQGLMHTASIRRIESQLMLLRNRSSQLPFQEHLRRHDRLFMEISREEVSQLQHVAHTVSAGCVPWAERYSEEIAHLLAASYKGHVDSEINDQYRTIAGARQFLTNIIMYPGCGTFSPQASVVALDAHTGRVCGVCLSSLVSANSGHITQLCVLPAIRGAHIGFELLRRSLLRLAELGCTSMSLTVTCSNIGAIRLYRSVGFRAGSSFPALVWEGF
jgi:ribosomal protein S18 acetylase RimI-like enzyme